MSDKGVMAAGKLLDEVESLRQQLAECQAAFKEYHGYDWDALKACHKAMREQTRELSEAQAGVNFHLEQYATTLERLAESQAREKVLRDALERVFICTPGCETEYARSVLDATSDSTEIGTEPGDLK